MGPQKRRQQARAHDVLEDLGDVSDGAPHGPADVAVQDEGNDTGPANRSIHIGKPNLILFFFSGKDVAGKRPRNCARTG